MTLRPSLSQSQGSQFDIPIEQKTFENKQRMGHAAYDTEIWPYSYSAVHNSQSQDIVCYAVKTQ